MPEEKTNLEKLISFLFKALVFLMPLFFLPGNIERQGMDGFNKYLLLWEIAPLLFLLFYFYSLKRNQLRLSFYRHDLLIGLYLTAAFLAAFMSLDKYGSLVGTVANIVSPFVSIFCLVIFYFFITHYFRERNKAEIFELIRVLIYSYFIVVALALALMVKQVSDLGALSGAFLQMVGNLEDLAMYLAVIGVLVFTILVNKYLSSRILSGRLKKALIVFFLGSFVLLLFIDFPPAWVVLAAGTFFSCASQKWLFKENNKPAKPPKLTLVWPIIFIVLPIIFLAVHLFVIQESKSVERLRNDLQLDYGNSLAITKASLAEHPWLGSGPETFPYVYARYHPVDINSGPFWYFPFRQAYSFVIDLAATTGLLGFIAYLAFASWFAVGGLRWLVRLKKEKRQKRDISLAILLLAPWLALVIGHFLYPQNAVLMFLFWLFVGLWVAWRASTTTPASTVYNKESHAYVFSVVTVALFLFFTGWLILVGLNARYWLAEYYFNSGFQSASEEQVANLETAIRLNPYPYYYYTELAKILKVDAVKVIANYQSEEELKLAQMKIDQSLIWAREAIRVAPNISAPYKEIGAIYRDIAPYTDEADIRAVKAFTDALNFEPNNPILTTELGKAYMAIGSTQNAIDIFKKALEQKPNYFSAELQLAKAYTEGQMYDSSLDILDNLAARESNEDVLFEQGRALYNKKEYEESIKKFRELLNKSPNHANALYSLGLALEATEDFDGALYYFNKVLALNPGHRAVEEKIKEIEAKIESKKE